MRLCCKPKDLSLGPWYPHSKQGMCVYKPRIGRQKKADPGSLAEEQLQVQSETLSSKIRQRGYLGGLSEKARQLEFGPWKPHKGGRRELTHIWHTYENTQLCKESTDALTLILNKKVQSRKTLGGD